MRFKVTINKRDMLATALLCLLALAAVLQVSAASVSRIPGVGTGLLLGLLGSCVLMAGIFWLFDSRLSPDEDEDVDIGRSKWRGVCGVASGVFTFLLVGKYLGLVPGVFGLVFVTVMGDPRHSWRSALMLALAPTTLATLVFFFYPDLPLAAIGMR